MPSKIIIAAQSVCQSVNGSNPEMTKLAHDKAVAELRDALAAEIDMYAAAPAMLRALKAFVDPWSRGGDWQSQITYETYNNARRAIAVAEGKP